MLCSHLEQYSKKSRNSWITLKCATQRTYGVAAYRANFPFWKREEKMFCATLL